MAIGSAVQRGSSVYVYDEKGFQKFVQQGELVGYTSASVSIRRNRLVYVYNERGMQTTTHQG